ncbi:hypothetical protein NFI96_004359, partial [Prochilodus magdalenae]
WRSAYHPHLWEQKKAADAKSKGVKIKTEVQESAGDHEETKGDTGFNGAKIKKEPEDAGDYEKTKTPSGELITFTVNTIGGKDTKTKQIVRNKKWETFKTLGVYAYSDETIESALKRDRRFADIVFQDGCTLDETNDKTQLEIHQNVKDLHGHNYEISLPRGKGPIFAKNNNPKEQASGSEIKTDSTATEVPESFSEVHPESTEQTRMKKSGETKSHRKPSSMPDYGEIMNILRDQFPDLVKRMRERSSSKQQEHLQLIKKNFVKNTQGFSRMCQLGKLVTLSSSVGRIKIGKEEGTAFLLFDNFILTNAHVIEKSYNDELHQLTNPATVNFDLKREGSFDKESSDLSLKLSPNVYAYMKGRDGAGRYVDFALLKMQGNSKEISELPRLLYEFTSKQDAQGICIIGHPGAGEKRMDVSCIVPHKATGSEPENRLQISVKFQADFSEFEVVGERSFIATYKTCFLEGSSGSPVFDENCKLVAMHTGGFFTDGKKEHIIEFGIPLCSIIWNIMDQLASRDSLNEMFTFIEEGTQNPDLEGFLIECVKALVEKQLPRHKDLLGKIYIEAKKNQRLNLLQIMNQWFSDETVQECAQLDQRENERVPVCDNIFYDILLINKFAWLCTLGVCLPRQYHYVNESKTWSEAQRYCREHYTDLASIDTVEEGLGLLNLVDVRSSGPTWIGLYDDLNSWRWSLEDDGFYKGKERNYRNWDIEKPTNYYGNSLCATITTNDPRWNEYSCSSPLPFICYDATSSTSFRQYHFVNESKTWTEAQRYCRELYTDLATIDNMEEMDMLINTVNANYSGLAWIGLYDDLDSWRWSLDDDSFYMEEERDYRGWKQEPDNYGGNELCVYMSSSGTWVDTLCEANHYFVCFDGTTRSHLLTNQRMSWPNAQRYCREHHTDLASVRNWTENQRILNMSGGLEVWIGLYRTRTWSDQHNFTYENWRPEVFELPKQPDNGLTVMGQYFNQHCTAVSFADSGLWRDEDCLATLPFVCYNKFCTGSSCDPHQYHFINEPMTWAAAQTYCRENYTDLATFDNVQEVNGVLMTVKDTYSGLAWIGLYDDLNSWRWSLDIDGFYKENERNFRNWHIMEPSNTGGDKLCVYFSDIDGAWYEYNCDSGLRFICYDGREGASQRYVAPYEYMIWTEAQRYCREHHTDLVSVRSEAENQMLKSFVKYYHLHLWIGLYRTRSWSDGSNSSFSNWRPGQPDNYGQNEHCTAVSFSDDYFGQWTDENCDQAFPFLCYSDWPPPQYHFVNESKTWTEAQSYCRELYTDLATIDNMEEMNMIINTVNGNYSGSAWIGLYDDLDSWRWSLDNDSFYSQDGRKEREITEG